jgi:hypothetical protein
VADVYGTVHWPAARQRWTPLAEVAVLKRRLAAERAYPPAEIVATRDETGTFPDAGDFAGGPADR